MGVRGPDVRGGGRLDRKGRRGGRTSACSRRVDRRDQLCGLSARRGRLAASTDSSERSSSWRGSAVRYASVAPTSPRTASTTSSPVAPIRCSSSTTSRQTASTSRPWPISSRGPRRSVGRRGVALVGGETAELPGIYREDELDFAGTCVGLVERSRLLDGSRVEEGDAVVGLASAGVRERVHARAACPRRRGLPRRRSPRPDAPLPRGRTAPSRSGARSPTSGGGFSGTGSCPPRGLQAEIDWDAWERLPVFAWLARHVEEDELRRVFNLGIGYLAVMPVPGDDLVIGRIVRA